SQAEGKIVNYLKEYESITNKEARGATGLSSSGARKVFDGLIQKKLIIALGDKKSRSYKLYFPPVHKIL
ncbi:MAG TPA: hypothetical protein VIK26_01350, partial [Clostridium sp.]